MKFEHVVIVNEPDNPLIDNLSREELWFGLLCRAENPCAFLPGLESSRVIERHPETLVRELDFGQLKIRDQVSLDPMQSVRFEAEQTADHPGGSLTIRIEEPNPDQLVLRFVYLTTLADRQGGPEDMYSEFVKSAYLESDIDTVRVIRDIAVAGRSQ